MKNMQMWRWVSAALLLTMCGMAGSRAQELAIQSFDGTGQLIFTALPTAEKYRVEWATTPSGPWKDFTETADAALNEIPKGEGGTITCSVPMDGPNAAFYRVVAVTAPAPAGMVLIPGGTQTGTNPDQDLGAYNLTVNPFHMDQYEVTQALWETVCAWATANGYSFDCVGASQAADHPVHSVNWYDVVKWCNARSEMEGLPPVYTVKGAVYKTGQKDDVTQSAEAGYRLPTATEWEYAARGGKENGRFPWDDADTIQHSRANYNSSDVNDYDTSQTRGLHPSYTEDPSNFFPTEACTSPVGSFAPNGYGLYDMAGNVSEWCFEWNPKPGSEDFRLHCGGSWVSTSENCRVGHRQSLWPGIPYRHIGFRTLLPRSQ